jgi:hypothetical protein
LLRNLELNGATGLTLHDDRAVKDASPLRYVLDAQTDEVAAAQFAIDSEVEKRKIPHLFR